MTLTSRAFGRESLSLTTFGIGTNFDYTRSGTTSVSLFSNGVSSGARAMTGLTVLSSVTNSVATGKKNGKNSAQAEAAASAILSGKKWTTGFSSLVGPEAPSENTGLKSGQGYSTLTAFFSSTSSDTKWTGGATALHGTWSSNPAGLLSYDGDTTFSAVSSVLSSGLKGAKGTSATSAELQHITLGATLHRGPAYETITHTISSQGRKNARNRATLTAQTTTSITGRKRSWDVTALHSYIEQNPAGTKSARRGTSAAIIFHNIPHYFASRRGAVETMLGTLHTIIGRKKSKGTTALQTGHVNAPVSQGRKDGLAPRKVLSLLFSSAALGRVSRAGRTILASTGSVSSLGRKRSWGGAALDLGIGTLLDGRKQAFGGTQLQASYSSVAMPKTARRGSAGTTTAQIHNILTTCKNMAGNSATNLVSATVTSGRKQGLARPKTMTLVSWAAHGTKRAQGSTSVMPIALSFVASHSGTKSGTTQLTMLASSVLRSGKNMAGSTVVEPLTIHDVATGADLTQYATSLSISLTPLEPSLELNASEPSYTFEVTAA